MRVFSLLRFERGTVTVVRNFQYQIAICFGQFWITDLGCHLKCNLGKTWCQVIKIQIRSHQSTKRGMSWVRTYSNFIISRLDLKAGPQFHFPSRICCKRQ